MGTQEIRIRTSSGWGWLMFTLVAAGAFAYALFYIIANGKPPGGGKGLEVWAAWSLAAWIVLLIGWCILLAGFFTLQPNQAAVLILFGRYVGTERTSGFHWANPFYNKIKVSLRARNLNMHTIKVNDLRGNPVEIAAVVVWRVEDSAQATFDVDNFEQYVSVQAEAALRHLASHYPYDTSDEHTTSLRGSMDDVNAALTRELHERVQRAGVVIEEARLSHLAYAPEIAGAMLQRQQAEAIVAARTRIVDGAVGIVEMALEKLDKQSMVKLDEERKAAMVNNLLVVLCGDKAAHPVVHTGTLYQ